jgi:hypothetical protein
VFVKLGTWLFLNLKVGCKYKEVVFVKGNISFPLFLSMFELFFFFRPEIGTNFQKVLEPLLVFGFP